MLKAVMNRMRRMLSVVCFLLLAVCMRAQEMRVVPWTSTVLEETRTLRIHLPASFQHEPERRYPLVVCLDGEYLFYSALGAAEVLRVMGQVPEIILVGIDQLEKDSLGMPLRWYDCDHDHETGRLTGKGILFKRYVEEELLPELESTYRAGPYKALVGHSFTANCINFFLLDEAPAFRGFGAISPYIPSSLEPRLDTALSRPATSVRYFLTTGDRDLSGHVPRIRRQDSTLFRPHANARFQYRYMEYADASHMELTMRAMPDVLRQLFSGYVPLDALGLDSMQRMPFKELDVLLQRKQALHDDLDIDMPVREDDLLFASWVAEEQADWNALERIGRYTVEQWPKGIYGHYMLGMAAEKQGQLEKALAHYKEGFALIPPDVLNKDDFREDVDRVEGLLKGGR